MEIIMGIAGHEIQTQNNRYDLLAVSYHIQYR